jgi:hypothetical protein
MRSSTARAARKRRAAVKTTGTVGAQLLAVRSSSHPPSRPLGHLLLFSERERLCGQLVGELASSASMEVGVDGTEMPIEDGLERFRLAQRARQAIPVRED